MHEETLTPEARELFPKLASFKEDFYLAGGTALALQLGHRVSVDFDLFSDNQIKRTLLARVGEVYGREPEEILVNNSRELTLMVSDVKHSFLHYPFPAILPLGQSGPIGMLAAPEILATKAYTIGRRGSFKDYIDLFVGIGREVSTLGEVIDLADKKYGDAFNSRLFAEQLLYLDDVDEDAIIMIGAPAPSKQEIIDLFSTKIRELAL